MTDGVGGHSDPSIGDGKQYVGPRNDHRMIAGIGGVEADVAGFNEDAAAAGQRVARVHHQIHNDLFDLSRISLNRPDLSRNQCLHLDVLAHQAPQQRIEIHYDGIEIENLWA